MLMAFVDRERGEVEFKIVLCGPAGAGKRSLLQRIECDIEAGIAAEWMPAESAAARERVFGFLPLRSRSIAGCSSRFNLFALPQSAGLVETGGHLMRGADGIVCVFDSRWDCMQANIASRRALDEFLSIGASMGFSVPLVFFYNKCGLADAAPAAYMDYALNNTAARWPSLATDALGGQGVFAGLNMIAKLASADFAV
jgi:signal recognition particle receptor subunit beta